MDSTLTDMERTWNAIGTKLRKMEKALKGWKGHGNILHSNGRKGTGNGKERHKYRDMKDHGKERKGSVK